MWAKDSQVDETLLDNAALAIPQLHQKYLTLLSEFTLLWKKKKQELKALQHKKWLYYSGKAAPEEYEDEPFPHKVIKADVQNWVGVDAQVQKVEMQIEYYETSVDTIKEIIRQINQMTYNIRAAIDWRKFVGGV